MAILDEIEEDLLEIKNMILELKALIIKGNNEKKSKSGDE